MHGGFSLVMASVRDHSPGKGARAVFLLLLAVYAVTADFEGGDRHNVDTYSSTMPAQRLVTHGDLDMTEFRERSPWFVPGRDGYVTDRPPGPTLVAVPFYLIVRPFVPLDREVAGPSVVAAIVVTAGAMSTLYLALRHLASPALALMTTLTYGLATPTWSISATALWPHGPNQLAIAVTLLVLVSRRRLWLLAPATALALLTRPIIIVPLGVIGAWLLLRRRFHEAAWMTGGGVVGIVGLVGWNLMQFGVVRSPYTSAFLERSTDLSGDVYLLRLLGSLLDPQRGLLFVTPLVVIAVIAGVRGFRQLAPEARIAAFAGVAYLLVHIAFNRFSSAMPRNYRYSLETITLLAPLVGVGLERMRHSTWGSTLAWLAGGWAFVFQLLLVFELDAVLGTSPTWLPWSLNA